MRYYSDADIIRMIKPNRWTYEGLGGSQKQSIKERYTEAKKYLNNNGVSSLLNLRINTLLKELDGLPDYIKKPVLSYAVMCGGLDHWEDPLKNRKGAF